MFTVINSVKKIIKKNILPRKDYTTKGYFLKHLFRVVAENTLRGCYPAGLSSSKTLLEVAKGRW